jgi:2'-5' RNA ligase
VSSLRLFVAVDVPRDLLLAVDSRVEPLRSRLEGARWAPVENQHVTLRFLGATPEDKVASLVESLRSTAARHGTFALQLATLGTFPERGKARVLWAGFDDPAPLVSLAQDLEPQFVSLGYASEKRAFSAHLTLARFNVPAAVRGLATAVDLSDLDPFTVVEVGLWRSHLSPKGARYELLERAPLRADLTSESV